MSHLITPDIQLSGIRNSSFAENAARVSVAAGGLLLALSLSGCSEGSPGIVMQGADGQNYELPDGAERPVYRSMEDCISDVKDQIEQLRQEGVEVTEAPEQLCEDTATYSRTHGGTSVLMYRGGYWGPILPGNSRWDSPRIIGWEPVANGMFAGPGAKVQSGISRAPAGARVGSKTTIRGGFGSSGKGGFAHGVGS